MPLTSSTAGTRPTAVSERERRRARWSRPSSSLLLIERCAHTAAARGACAAGTEMESRARFSRCALWYRLAGLLRAVARFTSERGGKRRRRRHVRRHPRARLVIVSLPRRSGRSPWNQLLSDRDEAACDHRDGGVGALPRRRCRNRLGPRGTRLSRARAVPGLHEGPWRTGTRASDRIKAATDASRRTRSPRGRRRSRRVAICSRSGRRAGPRVHATDCGPDRGVQGLHGRQGFHVRKAGTRGSAPTSTTRPSARPSGRRSRPAGRCWSPSPPRTRETRRL